MPATSDKQFLLDKNEESELRTLLVDYLHSKGFVELAAQAKAQFRGRGLSCREKPIDTNVLQVFDLKREQLVSAFEHGDLEEFETLWAELFDDTEAWSTEIWKLEFYFHLSFALYPLRNALNDEEVQKLHEKSVAPFKRYLESRGLRLSQLSELVPYFALPYVRQPKSHPLFKDLFQNSWHEKILGQLNEALDNRKMAIIEPKLARLYKRALTVTPQISTPARTDEILQKEHQALLKKFAAAQQKAAYLEEKCASYTKQFKSLQVDYRHLVTIAAELVDALEQNIRGTPITLEYLEEINARLMQSSKLSQPTTDVTPEPAALIDKTGAAAPAPASLKATLEEEPQTSEPIAPPPLRPVVTILDYQKLRTAIDKDEGRFSALLFQALRWMVTKNPSDVRTMFVQNYIIQDLLGSEENYKRRSTLQVFESNSLELRESALRFVNMLASLKSGRRYLSKGFALLTSLATLCKKESQPGGSLIFKHGIATLQKLSLRRSVQNTLIRLGVIDWLVKILPQFQKFDEYVLEYCIALLMNLSLRTAGKYRCADRPKPLLNTLKQLLLHGNKDLYPYINGTLYSILSLQAVRKCAHEMKMQKALEDLLKKAQHPSLKKQLPYVIKQLKGDATERDGALSSDDDDNLDEDDEEEDSLEPELDEADSLKPKGTELSGEQLLRAKFALSEEANSLASMAKPVNKKRLATSSPKKQESYEEQEPDDSGGKNQNLSSSEVFPKSRRHDGDITGPQPQQQLRSSGGAGKSINSSTFSKYDAGQRSQLNKRFSLTNGNLASSDAAIGAENLPSPTALEAQKKLPPMPPTRSGPAAPNQADGAIRPTQIRPPVAGRRESGLNAPPKPSGTVTAENGENFEGVDGLPTQTDDTWPVPLYHEGPAPVKDTRVDNMRMPMDANAAAYMAAFGSRPKILRTPNKDALKKRNTNMAAPTYY